MKTYSWLIHIIYYNKTQGVPKSELRSIHGASEDLSRTFLLKLTKDFREELNDTAQIVSFSRYVNN